MLATMLLVLPLMFAPDVTVESEGLIRDNSDLLSHSRDQRGLGNLSDLETTPCYKHKTCYECLQDPCSRYLDLRGDSKSDRCLWCKKLADVETVGLRKEACLSSKLASLYCHYGDTLFDKDGDVCSSSAEIREEKEDHCMVLGDRFALDLKSSNYTEVNQKAYPYFTISFGLCQSVSSSTVVGQQCGSKTPIQALEKHDYLLSISSQDESIWYCWYGGNTSDIHVTLHNPASPANGLTVSYGSSDCCPSGQIEPGTVNRMNVEVTLSPASSQCDDSDYWEVDKTNLPDLYSALYKCSPNQTIVYNILSSRFCPEFIDWQLDVNATTFHCQRDASMVQCYVTPVRLLDGQKCSQYVCRYPHIYFVFTTTNGTQVNRTLTGMTDHYNGSCSFRYSADGLSTIEAFYHYFESLPMAIAGCNPCVVLRQPEPEFNILKQSIYSIIYGPPILLLIVLIVIVIMRKVKHCRRHLVKYNRVRSSISDLTKQEEVEPKGQTNPVTIRQPAKTPEDLKMGATLSAPQSAVLESSGFVTTPKNTASDCDKDKMRSVCIVTHQRDREWSVEEIEKRLLKEIPNLCKSDVKCCGMTKVEATTETIQSSYYVIIVISRQEKELEDSGDYSLMRQIAEMKMTEQGPNPFLVSRDGDMTCIPKTLKHLHCANFSRPDYGWQELERAFGNE